MRSQAGQDSRGGGKGPVDIWSVSCMSVELSRREPLTGWGSSRPSRFMAMAGNGALPSATKVRCSRESGCLAEKVGLGSMRGGGGLGHMGVQLLAVGRGRHLTRVGLDLPWGHEVLTAQCSAAAPPRGSSLCACMYVQVRRGSNARGSPGGGKPNWALCACTRHWCHQRQRRPHLWAVRSATGYGARRGCLETAEAAGNGRGRATGLARVMAPPAALHRLPRA